MSAISPMETSEKVEATEATQLPIERYYEKLYEVIARCGAKGYVFERGIESRGDEDEDEDDDEGDEEDEEGKKDGDETRPKKKRVYTDEEISSQLRHMVLTERRYTYLEKMKKLILGDQYGDSVLMFNTSFSYEILEIVPKEIKRIKRHRTPSEKLDHLYGLTSALLDADVWTDDHEDCEGVQKIFVSISKFWKLLLGKSNEELEIDPEFTRPALLVKEELWNEAAKAHKEGHSFAF
jgi:hypothetical protein